MREWLKASYIKGASLFSTPKSGIYIMNGHYLSRQSNSDIDVFARLLGSMASFARFINIEDAARLVLNDEIDDVDETLVAFTFDDGFDDNILALAPALKRYDVNACFFVNPGFVEGDEDFTRHFTQHVVLTPGKKPMSWEQIKSLHNDGFVIGNHTHDHIRLSSVSLEEATRQVTTAKDKIEAVLGEPCEHFAWPFGQYADVNKDVIDMLLKHHRYVYSGCDYKLYRSFDGRVLNRRHFEADWPHHEVRFFLSSQRSMG